MRRHRVFLCFIISLICVFNLYSVGNADTSSISLNGNTWFGKKVEELGTYLESLGYKASEDNKTGLFKDVAWEYINDSMNPYSAVVWFDTDSRVSNYVVFKYKADEQLFAMLSQSFTMIYNQPEHTEYSEEKSGGYISITPELLIWNGSGIQYRIGCGAKADGTTGTIDDAMKGFTGFSVSILEIDEEPEDTPEPTDTPKPTPTLKPVDIEVSIDSVDIKDTNYGTRYFYIRFKNNAKVNVDRIDFKVQGFNRYGERIVQYNVDTIDFYYDGIIKPGKTTPSNWRYNYFMLDEATTIKIAIIKYHTSDGKTVEVPEYHWQWLTYEMKNPK